MDCSRVKREKNLFPMENRLAPWRFKVRSKQYSQRYRHTTCRVGRVRWLMLIIHGSTRYRWNEFQLWIANLNIKPCKANVNNVGTVSGTTANIYICIYIRQAISFSPFISLSLMLACPVCEYADTSNKT